MDLAFSGFKGYPGQVKWHSLPFQEEAVLKYLVVPLTFALDCTYDIHGRHMLQLLCRDEKESVTILPLIYIGMLRRGFKYGSPSEARCMGSIKYRAALGELSYGWFFIARYGIQPSCRLAFPSYPMKNHKGLSNSRVFVCPLFHRTLGPR